MSGHPVKMAPEGSSPHTRGALEMTLHKNGLVGIIPAYAGSTRRSVGKSRGPGDHPRIRGEHRRCRRPLSWTAGSSPHTRGAPKKHPQPVVLRRIIPAYAGSTSRSARSGSAEKDHPRIRGEYGPGGFPAMWISGSSPHTRGALGDGAVHLDLEGIIPAYAGSTDLTCRLILLLAGSSPHTRGAHPVVL